jgi:succinate dehydrogenase / fumarate reductase cytochrome b subunit
MAMTEQSAMTRIRSAVRWFDTRHRGPETWAYALNRITGLVLVAYLYIHLAVLSLLVRGPASYDTFVDVVRSPVFLSFDLVLIAGWLIHALNGLRLTVIGLGFGVRAQRTMLVGATVIGSVVLVVMGLLLFGG